MKITTKTTKEQIITALGMNASAIKKVGGELFDRMNYTDKMLKKDPSKVKRADLVGLLKDVMNTLGDKFKEPSLQPVAENSVKKTVGKKTTAKAENDGEPTAPKKSVKKGSKPKVDDTKATKSKTTNKPKENKLYEVKDFADTFEVKDDDGEITKYEIAHDIKTMEDLNKVLSNEEEAPIIFAFHWNKDQLKVFGYFNRNEIPVPKSFPDDLDLATCIYASDNNIVAYALSMYTEANYCILPSDLEETEEGIRYCGGIDYQIYRQVEA